MMNDERKKIWPLSVCDMVAVEIFHLIFAEYFNLLANFLLKLSVQLLAPIFTCSSLLWTDTKRRKKITVHDRRQRENVLTMAAR